MNKIGFGNFRRFTKFSPIEYRGITFLVGQNNSGKSTVVKALLLVHEYLKSGDIFNFSFVNHHIEETNIVTYGRAKNTFAAHDFISFELQIDAYIIEIVISGVPDKTVAFVEQLLISDTSKNINYHFKPFDKSLDIFKGEIFESEQAELSNQQLQTLEEEVKKLKAEIENSELKKSSKDYLIQVDELNTLMEKRMIYETTVKSKPSPYNYFLTARYSIGDTMEKIVETAISDAIDQHDLEFPRIQQGESASDKFPHYRAIKEEQQILETSFSGFYDYFWGDYSSVFYLGANPSKQSALFSIRDKNNALAQSIHDFFQLRILPGMPAHQFVLRWMKAFEVGDDFEIIIHAGEAYEVNIVSNGANIHLADKGMGSIQAMLLILRLAAILEKTIYAPEGRLVTVVIEEPELNLHPALQSKLADLFLECHEKYALDFVIETHSEYILRRSQVLVAEKEFEVAPNENPFCVHYFPKDLEHVPYRLEYQEDGSFNKNFGDGFFDEAASSTLELLKLKRQKKA